MILLDTDVCIELLKGNKRILQRREQYDDAVGICFMTIADADILIASATLEKAERLITGNTKHFERIPGLSLENWT